MNRYKRMHYKKFLANVVVFILSFIVFLLIFMNWDLLKAWIFGG